MTKTWLKILEDLFPSFSICEELLGINIVICMVQRDMA